MKDSLFEMLLNLFEKTLSQLKEDRVVKDKDSLEEQQADADLTPMLLSRENLAIDVLKSASQSAMRVFTDDERFKLTKTSYQFLMRLHNLGVVTQDDLEKIVNHIIFSDSRFVGLQEVKWIIRNTLSDSLNTEQLAFLDLVLYQKEDELPLH